MRTSTNGVLQVLAGVLASLQSAQSGLREAAVQTLLARKAARQQAQQKKDDARREAGRADLSKLTVPLLRQERLARGETVEVRIPKRRDELLRAVEAARAAEPAIPTPLDAPPPPPAAAPAAAQAPVAQALVLDASLVGAGALGRCDPDDTPPSFSWYPATIVKYRTGSRVKYKYVLHGADVQLDDEDLKSIKVLDDRVERCTCNSQVHGHR